MPDGEAERRKKLVVAAEQVMGEWATRQNNQDKTSWKVEKSQLNQLIGVCGEALCAEEIENYLRYQASRERPSWGLSLVERTIKGIASALVDVTEDRERIEAWRYYAVFLARAYTYRKKVTGGGEPRDRVR